MKRFAFIVLVLACLVSCKTDLTDIENRITEVEKHGQTLDSKTKQLMDESKRLSDDIKELQKKSEELGRESNELQREEEELEKANQALKDELQALKTKSIELATEILNLQEEGKVLSGSFDNLKAENDLLVKEWNAMLELIEESQRTIEQLNEKINQTYPKLLHMEFLASENPLELVEDAECEIIGDSVVECRVLNLMSAKNLIPRFRFTGDYVTIGGQVALSSKTMFDFSKELVLVVHSGEKTKEYIVNVSAYTGLPTLWAETNGRSLKDANYYYKSTFSLVDNVGYEGKGSLPETTGRIMAMGSLRYYKKADGSGGTEPGKNDYRLNFSNAVPMLDMPSHTDWRLVPNVNDVTMLHNQTAFYMSLMSNLDYTPRYRYVVLMFNGRYSGTYMLGESLSADTRRVDVGVDGYILNISSVTSGSAFTTTYLEQPVSILHPSSQSAAVVNYIASFVNDAENVLFSSYFTDESGGWQKYLDMNSFVDWYLINEIAKNSKGAFMTNCIMNYRRGGKLKMGPIWDFETAFGNAGKTSSNGFVIKDVRWYKRLFQDPVFVAKVKERFDYFFNHQEDIIKNINESAQYLKYAIQEDNTKWDTFLPYKSSGADTWILYQGQVSSMKSWLTERMRWLKEQFDAM